MSDVRTTAPTHYRVLAGLVFGALAGIALGLVLAPPVVVAGVVDAGAAVRYGLPVTRVLLDVSATVVVGLSILPKLLGFDRPAHTEPVMRLARPAAVVAAAVWVVTALLAIVLQAAELRPGSDVSIGNAIDYIATVGAGKGLLFSAACAFGYLLVGVMAVRGGESVPAELRILISMFGLLPIPVTGHASNWKYHDYSMVSMELHVLGAAAWAGGLGALMALVAHRKGLLAVALPKFSRIATVSLVVVTVTGLFNGLLELVLNPVVPFPQSLVTTGYGLLVLAKTLCAVAVAALGAHIRWRLLPRIARHQVTAIVQWAVLEVAVMGLAFGLAVVLSRAPVS
ncbi:copper resistance D family protein [Nocardia sp. NRRL S-836]|uniref:copper resistance D family protein n=1 Tax=Nocardia sp. NRRL S-836 TaxID=1519492 RepID=UPI0006AEE38C|nr:CopD family protein [Nocardia sp. NRRL S-836]KOV88920.1 copper resistance protein CopD [Nocardia sp. NRRL S-836]